MFHALQMVDLSEARRYTLGAGRWRLVFVEFGDLVLLRLLRFCPGGKPVVRPRVAAPNPVVVNLGD